MKLTITISISILLIAGACSKKTNKSSIMITNDIHSQAKPNEVVVTHLLLDANVNFETKTIIGKASWIIDNKTNSNELILDTRDLTITKVTLDKEEKGTSFKLDSLKPIVGQALHINIEPGTTLVNVYYSTSPNASALQWLSPQQTAGKKYPFLFTQSQAILARTWIPCQDSPGIRFTYDAKITVPSELMAVMSATNPVEKNMNGVYSFKMEQRIPSYLMALSVGDLQFKSLGENTGVYAEPSELERSAYEFAGMEEMLTAAEKLYGKYAWERYDVIVLPPSFPFGGMENPRLTFATPTILAGDRSLVSLVAHELAHSWSGNLVTNSTWNDFWLNEGFTVYFERRIMEAIEGRSYAEMLAALGYQDLEETVNELGNDNKDTWLKLDLTGRDPDEGLTDVAYEKGYFFLRLLEETAGREKFDAFLKEYFQSHAFQTITTDEFISYLNANLIEPNKDAFVKIDINKWIFGPGIPDNCPVVKSERFSKVDEQITSYNKGTNPEQLITKNWSSHEWLRFIRGLPEQLSEEKMKQLDATFKFTNSGNSELLDAWFLTAINNNYAVAFPAMEKFLINVGRRKFLTPLYKAMIKTEQGKKMALEIYAKARPNYHFVATQTMDELLGWKG